MSRKVRRKFLPKQKEFFSSTEDEVLYSGAFGAGKTRILCEKILFLGMKYPGISIGVFRKTKTSLNFTTLKSFLSIVPKDYIEKYNRSESTIVLRNGSEYIFGGFEEPSRWGSLELGAAACDELIEFDEVDYNMLLGRLRQKVIVDSSGTNRILPFRQIVSATNPGSPNHWLFKRAFVDKYMHVVESKTSENVYNPKSYLKLMQRFKGRYYERFVEGKWISFEGAVYENWNPLIHIVTPFPIPHGWRRIRAIDFGYANPFVCLWIAESPDGILYVYRQLYGTKRLVEHWATDIKRLDAGEPIEATVCDWDAEDRATLEYHLGITTLEADKAISPGIQLIHRRLTPVTMGEEEKPTLMVFENSLANEPDEDLSLAGKPLTLEDEFPGYSWPKNREGKPIKEVPIKIDDHALDTVRYGAAYFENQGTPEGLIVHEIPVVYDDGAY